MEDVSLCLNCDKKKVAENFFIKAGLKREWKLVRDKFPDLVKESEEEREFKDSDPKQKIQILKEKILEEAVELYFAEGECNVSDLADIQELSIALVKAFDIPQWEIEKVRKEKLLEKGAYDKGFLMKLK
jgi:predicted house-cleaning noncanonical NTP pyrophosphatase (MazG superfamily)